ncbi:MAG TPA: hypothetical protein VIW23_13050 [Candidatus Acidoferrum sp.]|jgi:hypothetical protein
MTMSCQDREQIFLDGTPQQWAAFEAHAASCIACGEELRAWKNLSIAAKDVRQEWDSPSLWPRIEQALSRQTAAASNSPWRRIFGWWNLGLLQWQMAAAVLLLLALTGSAVWFVANRQPGRGVPQNQALLNDRAVNEVERAEAAYERAIDKLDAQARPQLQNSSAPLMANYREKLLVLDSAIADLKSQAGINPANGHLRRQLLAMYQAKQDTLEQVLEAKQ